MRIPENEIADEEAKAALEDDLLSSEKSPSQDLINLDQNRTQENKKNKMEK
jgi:hypothetical protein